MLADSIGAVPGNDTNGPTSLINSVLCYNHIDSGSGFVLQTKYDKKIISTQKGKEALIAIAKAYFAGGGQQFTVSVVNPEELIDAQKNGKLEECFGTGTAAVISPVGKLRYVDDVMIINNNCIGEVSQKLYDTLTGIQWGKREDDMGWTVEV